MSTNDTPYPTKEPLLHQDDSSDAIGTLKPRAAADEHEVENRDPLRTDPGRPFRRHWVRPLVLIFIPSIVTAYYGVIWVHLVQKSAHDEAAKYRTYSGSLIFYSWFLIGVFGLSWAKFGLVGVEAVMLRTHFWGAPNLVTLLMHSDGTWSSPSGWIKAIAHRDFHRLWSLLALTSLLPFIALPLSGLVFEISDGYIRTSDAPSVAGRNMTSFNVRYDTAGLAKESSARSAPAQVAWLSGSAPVIPGIGIIYTNESVDRSKHSIFKDLPNSLPLTEPIPDLFLAPQADNPVSGTAWGLRIKYNCSIVRSVSQFTILSEKSASSINDALPFSDSDNAIRLLTPSGDEIALWTSMNIADSAGHNSYNTQAYFEVGTSAPQTPEGTPEKYDGKHPEFELDEGDASLVFEYAMWQLRVDTLYEDSLQPFNDTIGPSIEGLGSPVVESDNSTFTLNGTFFTISGDRIKSGFLNSTGALPSLLRGSSYGRLLYVAPPTGIRCVASSDLGTAELDGVTSTFGNFQRVPPNFNQSTYFHGALRFGRTAQVILDGQYFQHYHSGDLPGPMPGRFEQNVRYERFIDPESLLRSVNLAYALDASNLMYDVTSNFRKQWLEPRLKASRKGKILSVASLIPGAAVGYLVLALFCTWAALSAALGLWYGFRRMPTDRLDGYAMLRKGADISAELQENNEFTSGTLAAMPGNVSGTKS